MELRGIAGLEERRVNRVEELQDRAREKRVQPSLGRKENQGGVEVFGVSVVLRSLHWVGPLRAHFGGKAAILKTWYYDMNGEWVKRSDVNWMSRVSIN